MSDLPTDSCTPIAESGGIGLFGWFGLALLLFIVLDPEGAPALLWSIFVRTLIAFLCFAGVIAGLLALQHHLP